MFCMALCVALSGQITIAMLDRIQHVLDIAHAPNPIAGGVRLHHHGDAHETAHADHHAHHDQDGVAHSHGQHDDDDGENTPLSHQHASNGMLAPWLTSAGFVIVGSSVVQSAYQQAPLPPPDVAEPRRDRPPKPGLEIVV